MLRPAQTLVMAMAPHQKGQADEERECLALWQAVENLLARARGTKRKGK